MRISWTEWVLFLRATPVEEKKKPLWNITKDQPFELERPIAKLLAEKKEQINDHCSLFYIPQRNCVNFIAQRFFPVAKSRVRRMTIWSHARQDRSRPSGVKHGERETRTKVDRIPLPNKFSEERTYIYSGGAWRRNLPIGGNYWRRDRKAVIIYTVREEMVRAA